MDLLTIVVQWLHVVFGALWLGGSLLVTLAVFPVLARSPLHVQRDFGRRLAPAIGNVFAISASVTFLLGLIRGTVLGPIQSFDVLFGSAYGITWLVALVVTIGLMVWGARVVGGAAERLYNDDSLWTPEPGDRPSPALTAALARQRGLGIVDLAGFAIVITCMILMRFGL